MPVNKNAFRRFHIIHQLIKAGKFPSAAKLAEDCDVTEDQVKIDIRNLRYQWEAPIVYSKKHGGYYYADNTFFLPAVMVSETELDDLKLLGPLIEPLRGTPAYKTFNKFIQQIYDLAGYVEPEILRSAHKIFEISNAINAEVLYSILSAARYLTKIEFNYLNSIDKKAFKVSPIKVYREGNDYTLLGKLDNGNYLKFSVSLIADVKKLDDYFAAPNDEEQQILSNLKILPFQDQLSIAV